MNEKLLKELCKERVERCNLDWIQKELLKSMIDEAHNWPELLIPMSIVNRAARWGYGTPNYC